MGIMGRIKSNNIKAISRKLFNKDSMKTKFCFIKNKSLIEYFLRTQTKKIRNKISSFLIDIGKNEYKLKGAVQNNKITKKIKVQHLFTESMFVNYVKLIN